jgi:hypothetical protein
MERPEWYDGWAGEYLKMHGLNTAANTETILSWWVIFGMAGVTADELALASLRLLNADSRPIQFGDHLYALKRLVFDARQQREKIALLAKGDDRGECTRCRSTGMVSVPHPGHADAEGWRPVLNATTGRDHYPTTLVYCSCPLGQWKENKQAQQADTITQRMMSLESYQIRNPYWREQLDQLRMATAIDRGVTDWSKYSFAMAI